MSIHQPDLIRQTVPRAKTVRVYRISEVSKRDLASAWFASGICLDVGPSDWPPRVSVESLSVWQVLRRLEAATR